MSELCRLIWCGLIGFFRSRASLEAEILVHRHQLNILRRKSPRRPTFGSIDRLIFAGLYGVAPNALSALAIVRPETVIRWHRAGFRWYWRWKSKSPGGRPKLPVDIRGADPRHQSGQSALWCSEDSWRATQAGHHYRPDYRSQVYGEEQETAVARLEDLSAQPRRRDCFDGPVCGPDNLVLAPVWAADSEAWAPRNPVSCGDRASQRGMDKSPTDGGLRLGAGARLSRSRSGQRLWRGLYPAPSCDGHSGSADRAAVAVAEWLL